MAKTTKKAKKDEKEIKKEKNVKEEKQEVKEEIVTSKEQEKELEEIVANRNKELKTLGVCILVVVALVALFFLSESRDKSNDKGYVSNNPLSQEEIKEEEQKDFNDITFAQFSDLINAEGSHIIFVGRPTCSWCNYQTPVLKNVAYLYNLEVNYLNIDTFTSDEFTAFIELDESSSAEQGIATPKIFVVGDGTIKNRADGGQTKDELITFFQQAGLIK